MTEMRVAFIDKHPVAYGVEPIFCPVADRPIDLLRAQPGCRRKRSAISRSRGKSTGYTRRTSRSAAHVKSDDNSSAKAFGWPAARSSA